MSGEFGSYQNGYIHSQVEQHAEDCLRSNNELTKLWGEFFKAMHPMMHGMCWYEAADSGFDTYVMACIQNVPELKERLRKIEEYLKPYKDVAANAVREYADKKRDFEGEDIR